MTPDRDSARDVPAPGDLTVSPLWRSSDDGRVELPPHLLELRVSALDRVLSNGCAVTVRRESVGGSLWSIRTPDLCYTLEETLHWRWSVGGCPTFSLGKALDVVERLAGKVAELVKDPSYSEDGVANTLSTLYEIVPEDHTTDRPEKLICFVLQFPDLLSVLIRLREKIRQLVPQVSPRIRLRRLYESSDCIIVDHDHRKRSISGAETGALSSALFEWLEEELPHAYQLVSADLW